MGSVKVPGILFGIELGFQIGMMIRDVWREVKKEMAEKDKPTVCLDCPLVRAMEDPPTKTKKI